MMYRKLGAFFIILLPFLLHAQDDPFQEITNTDKLVRPCRDYFWKIRTMPSHDRYDLQVIDGEIVLFFRDPKLFKKLFNKENDGLAIDILHQSLATCEGGNVKNAHWAYDGELIAPVFRDELNKRSRPGPNGGIKIVMGTLPANFHPNDIELNLLIIQKNYLCHRQRSFGMIDHQWNLLEMDLLSDYAVRSDSALADNRNKRLVENAQVMDPTPLETTEDLIKLFHQMIRNRQFDSAQVVQHTVFDRILSGRASISYLDQLVIPKSAEFVSLHLDQLVFSYHLKKLTDWQFVEALRALLLFKSKNVHLRYDLTVMHLKLSNANSFADNRKQFRRLISVLGRRVPEQLRKRLLINFHMMEVAHFDNQNDPWARNDAIKGIERNYESVGLSDEERLYLIKFYYLYGPYGWPISLFADHDFRGDENEELLDHYIRLTLEDEEFLQNEVYRSLVDRFIENHRDRFCDMFLPEPQGGFSFQLFFNEELAEMYCETCQ